MAGKYEQKIRDAAMPTKEYPNLVVIGDDAFEAMKEADAEIADLREKCEKLAGAVEAKIWTRDDCVTTVCHHCGGEGPNEYIEHKSGCPVQIAQEVKG